MIVTEGVLYFIASILVALTVVYFLFSSVIRLFFIHENKKTDSEEWRETDTEEQRKETYSILETKNWVDDLVKHCEKENIKSIIGINRGGILVGAYIGIRLGIPDANILRCSVVRDTDSRKIKSNEMDDVKFFSNEFECLKNGNVLLIDDVCRSGRSFMLGYDYTVEKIKNLYGNDISENIFSMTLVANTEGFEYMGESEKRRYAAHITDRLDARLPWHDREAEEYIVNEAEIKHRLKLAEEKLECKRLKDMESILTQSNEQLATVLRKKLHIVPKAA